MAEILITLGIVGVVAALTIPGLMTAYKAHQLRAQFLKSYSTVQQVFKQMEADDVSLDPATYSTNDRGAFFYKVFMNYLKGATECYTRSVKSCYPGSPNFYKAYDGKNNIMSWYFDDGQILLPDGTLLLFENPSKSSNGGNIFVSVDLNGWTGLPNKAGYDLFVFEFFDGELKTMGDKGTTFPVDKYCDPNAQISNNGLGCAHRAKTETDYFKSLVKYFK